jgi:Ser-tRNA(Ala) deacylase AlaX
MTFERRTRKLYYEDFFLTEAKVKVVKVGTDYIELDATVAYPEGGGQDADQGTISFADGRLVRFIWAKKLYTHRSGLTEFPDVQVDGIIRHRVHPDDILMLANIQPGTEVTVAIDIERRARLSLSHTASHLLYLAVSKYRQDVIEGILGCHIKTDGARFDFRVNERFTSEEISNIEEEANALVTRDVKIEISAHPDEPDARLWHAEGYSIPCGGTHLDHTAPIGRMHVKRKGLGASKERVSCVFPDAKLTLDQYHS